MFASHVERRFYQTFFRWNNALKFSNHSARRTHRPFSSTLHVRSNATEDIQTSEQVQSNGQPIPTPTLHHPVPSEYDDESPNPTSEAGEESRHQFTDAEWQEITKERVRKAFRFLTYPVAIVTARGESPSRPLGSLGDFSLDDQVNHLDLVRAMTVSSLNTVSMNPVPIISFNVRVPSSTWDAISATKQLSVFLLRTTPDAIAYASSFSKGETRSGLEDSMTKRMRVVMYEPNGDSVMLNNDEAPKYQEAQQHMSHVNVAPQFQSRSIFASLMADLRPESCVTVNDHVIVVAEVTAFCFGRSNKKSHRALTYSRGQFVELDPADDKKKDSTPKKKDSTPEKKDSTPEKKDHSTSLIRTVFPQTDLNDGPRKDWRWLHYSSDDTGELVARGLTE